MWYDLFMFCGSQIFRHAVCVFAFCASVSRADIPLEASFRDLPADASRPCVAVALDKLSREKETLSRQLLQVRELGTGGVLVRVPVADDAVWAHLKLVSDVCRRLGLELGVCDFSLSAEEALQPRVQRLVWTSRRIDASGTATNECSPVFQPSGSYRELAQLAVPEEGEILPHQIVDLKFGAAPTNGLWRAYRFGCSDVEPPLVDCFDGNGVFRHVNQLLFACQGRLERTYGTTLLWCQMAGYGRDNLAWPRDLPETFLKQSGLGLMRHLPALAGVAVGGEPTAAYVRQQVAHAVCEAWHQRYAKNVDELVHEAGLEAGICIDEVPIDPEEVALYFRRPTLSPARTLAHRAMNVRAAGGARALGRRFVVGRLDSAWSAPTSAEAQLPFPCKNDADLLLSDGVTRTLLEGMGDVPEEGERFAQMRVVCRYTHRCQVMLQHGEAVADFLVWSTGTPQALEEYSCDCANQAMLAAATVKDGKVRFESERTYAAVAVTADVVRDKASERRVKQLAADGVGVWLVASGLPGEEAVIARLSEGGRCKVLGAAGEVAPVPDLQWEAEAKGVSVRFLHRRSPEYEIYFVVNASAVGGPVTCTFRDIGQGWPSRWNPVTGETGLSLQATRMADGRVSVPLLMVPHDACFVVFPR